jgi:hypothetical protein
MTKAIQLLKDVSGAYVAYDRDRTICATWNREHAESALEYHIKSLKDGTNAKVIGSWDQ